MEMDDQWALMRKQCDILIIGAGGAGLQAAITLSTRGEELGIIVVDKGIVGKSGCTMMGGFSCNAVLGTNPDDSPSCHFADTVREGRFINDQPLVEIYTEQAADRVRELHALGSVFEETEEGTLKQELVPGHSHPRALFNNLHTGKSMAIALRKAVLKSGTDIVNECIILRILCHDSTVWGAVGFDMTSGTFILFSCKAIIITTGGCGQLYPHSTTPQGTTGDGYALAYEAGAEIQDMEFIQFFPTAQCYPRLLHLNPTFPSMLRYIAGCRLYNSEGREFMKETQPDWIYTVTRDELSQAIYREIQEGRGSPHGGVYMDVLHLPDQEIKDKFSFSNIYTRLLSMGIDLTEDRIETTVSAHFSMGGIRVDTAFQTCVQGLFAAGEALGGLHGANRLPGNALSDILVTGNEAALSALRYVNGHSPCEGLEYDGYEVERVSALMKRDSGMNPLTFKKTVQTIMWDHAGVIRNGEDLRRGIKTLRTLHTALDTLSVSTKTRIWNKELLDFFEAIFMITVAQRIMEGALFREESRGSHQRTDHPRSDNSVWLVNIIHRKGHPLRTCRPRVSRIPLEELHEEE